MGSVVSISAAENARGWSMTDAEQDVCVEMVGDGYPFAVLLYLLEIRPNMDWRTRVSGFPRRLSEKGFMELLERRTKPGSHYGKKQWKRGKIQRQISALEKYGLIERTEFPLVFSLPLAGTGVIRAQEERTQERTEKQHSNPHGCPVLSERSGQRSGLHQLLLQQQYRVILDAYHFHLPRLPKVLIVSDGLRAAMTDIWNLDERHQTEKFWQWFFARCAKSEFITGRDFDKRKGPFKANLTVLLNKNNFEKIMNGEWG